MGGSLHGAAVTNRNSTPSLDFDDRGKLSVSSESTGPSACCSKQRSAGDPTEASAYTILTDWLRPQREAAGVVAVRVASRGIRPLVCKRRSAYCFTTPRLCRLELPAFRTKGRLASERRPTVRTRTPGGTERSVRIASRITRKTRG